MTWWEGTTRSDSLRGETLRRWRMEIENGDGAGGGNRQRDQSTETTDKGETDRQTDRRQQLPSSQDPGLRTHCPGVRHASKSRRRLHGRIWTGDEGSKRGANFSSHLLVRQEWMAAWAKKQQRRHRRPSQDRELDRTDRLTGPEQYRTEQTTPHQNLLTVPRHVGAKGSATCLDERHERKHLSL